MLAAGSAAVIAVACDEHLPRPFAQPDVDGGSVVDSGSDAELADASDGGALVDAAAACVVGDAGGGPAFGLTPLTTASLSAVTESAYHDGSFYVLEQSGQAMRIAADGTATVFLDVSSIIVSGGEAGLLGIAFHPQFATNGYVYLYYTAPTATQPPPTGVVFESEVVRYQSKDNGLTLDSTTAKRIITVDQPFTNHNGATLQFGPDGFLYWGLGDGGSEGDPNKTAQNLQLLLGKILRIDVDNGDPYSIPPTNPFATNGLGKPEIFAYGFRNPFRYRFDTVSGDLWVGDVGQDLHEEIDKVTLGGNYGWSIREGDSCYLATTCEGTDAGLIDPIVSENRDQAVTITGGVVYHGAALPQLTGKYVFGDYGLQKFYTIPTDQPTPTQIEIAHSTQTINVTSFTLDGTGEIVITDYNGGLYRLTPPVFCP